MTCHTNIALHTALIPNKGICSLFLQILCVINLSQHFAQYNLPRLNVFSLETVVVYHYKLKRQRPQCKWARIWMFITSLICSAAHQHSDRYHLHITPTPHQESGKANNHTYHSQRRLPISKEILIWNTNTIHRNKRSQSASENRTEEPKLPFNQANILNTALINIICIQNQHHIKIVLLWQS